MPAPISNSTSRGGHEAGDPLPQRVQLPGAGLGIAQSAPGLPGQRRPSALDRLPGRCHTDRRVHSYTDYWGTRVDEFGIVEPHRDLRIMAESTVETATAQVRPGTRPSTCSTPCERSCRAFSGPRPTPSGMGLSKRRPGWPSAARLRWWTSQRPSPTRSHPALDYVPGATYVGVDVADVMSQGKGVCQDFAHLGIAMYRSIGIPARYVSGYLYAVEQTSAVAPDEPELSVQTHAWLEVFVPGYGWWGLDPTNAEPVGELHVKIGHGRDYQDVMPLAWRLSRWCGSPAGVQVRISRERLSQMAEQ